jgi:tripartite-type tricarboxylate transporter receptor subunit TctC
MRRALASVMLACCLVSAATAEDYPSHPVKVIVGYAAGGGPDIQARLVSQQLSAELGQQFFVENRTGANGTLAVRTVVGADPDGYTLLFSSSSISPTPYIYKSLGYDLITDLKPVATVGVLDGIFMLVNGSSPIHSVQEFIDYARKNPVTYGSPGVGNELHLAAATFASKAGISMQHVPFKGAGEVLTALLSKSIDVMFVTPPSVMGAIAAGQVRAIAFTGTKPFPAYPDVPLMSKALPGYEHSGSWGMFYAPAKTPQPIVDKLNAAIQEALKEPKVAARMQRDGYMPDGRSAAETAALFKETVEHAKDAVARAHIDPM